MLFHSFRNLPNRIKSWNTPLLVQIWFFLIILLFFQLLWESFEEELSLIPFLLILSDTIGKMLLTITPELLNPLIKQDIVRSGAGLILPGGFTVSYFFYLSGIKQMCLVIILFLLVPGPWVKKVWYIPLNILMILLLVLIRFVMLTMHCLAYPEHMHLIQDLLFGPMFYFEILIMWLAWVLIVAKTARI